MGRRSGRFFRRSRNARCCAFGRSYTFPIRYNVSTFRTLVQARATYADDVFADCAGRSYTIRRFRIRQNPTGLSNDELVSDGAGRAGVHRVLRVRKKYGARRSYTNFSRARAQCTPTEKRARVWVGWAGVESRFRNEFGCNIRLTPANHQILINGRPESNKLVCVRVTH